MRNITFNLSTMHMHGSAFHDFLKLRKTFFVDGLQWEIPNDGIVEMDQYDTPIAHYSVVLRNGRVVGGARCQRTDLSWGDATCMMKDAVRGLMPGIPADLFDPATCCADLWEGTRLVIADELTTMTERIQCLALIVDGLMRIIGHHGGTRFITLSPPALQRTARMVGAEAARISRTYTCNSDGREYALFETKVARAPDRLLALGIDPETAETMPAGIAQAAGAETERRTAL